MEKLMHREDAFRGYDSPNRRSSEDLDFDDVFGGPPRRFSMQEVKVRYSFGESEEDGGASSSSPWKEKPVFGEESSVVQRKRHQGDDFFNDIFKGGESPRRADRDRETPFGSNPGSRIMSPARPLPPRTDPSGSSLPALFSLPAKLTKGIELPTFASHKMEGTLTNGLNSPHSSSTSLSRFSSQVIRGQDEIRNRHNHLSREASFSSEDDSPSSLTSDKKDNSRKDTKNGDGVGNQFHFSIYKWAGRGVPMLMTLVAGNNLKSKDNIKYDTSASSNGRMESESLKVGNKKEYPRSKEEANEVKDSVEATYAIPEPDVSVVLDGAGKNIDEQVKSEVKRVHVSLSNEVEKPGNAKKTKETKSGTPKEVHANALDGKKLKKNEGTGSDSRNATVDKPSLQSASTNPGVTRQKSVGKGKVREFVQIFNQETDSTPAADVEKRSQSYRRKNGGADQKESEASSGAAKAKQKDVPLKVDENPNSNETEKSSPVKAPRYTTNNASPKKAFSSETLHTDSNISVENLDDPSEDNFLVQELPNDHDKVTEKESSEDTKTIDAKIREWSVGKKGNIRSLLSTLQYVLWPESGWKAVPLVDLIEANSVKRAYQKALLRLHPDKLQQKGATFNEKYTAEKVFDILQEAWDHFNTSSSLNL